MKKKSMVNLNRLEALLSEKNWGVGELSTYSGVKYDTVYSLRAGRRPNTRAETLKRIADALDTSIDYLLGESDIRKPVPTEVPEAIRRISEIAGRLSESRQEELLRIAHALEGVEQEESGDPTYIAATRELLKFAQQHQDEGGENLLPLLRALLRNAPPHLLTSLQLNDQANSPGESH